MKKKKLFLILAAAAVMACTAAAGVACRRPDPDGGTPGGTVTPTPGGETPGETLAFYEKEYPTFSRVGYSAEILGTVARQNPEVSNGGLAAYPTYGKQLYGGGSANAEEKQAILAENAAINAGSASYNTMDAEGNLYLNGTATGKKLYQHTAAAGMYYGNVSDEEPALVKRMTIQARNTGDHITGLYAPAGEVIKIEMSEEDLARTGGLTVAIGQELVNGQANNIWDTREFNRMPVIVNQMTVNSAVSYVGSYLGGPIYVKPVKAGTKFTVTITGGVAYPHYIHGYTTKQEYEQNLKSSAPYFDLEVWDCVRHSGPAASANLSSLDYENMYRAAEMWEKISSVSKQVPAGSRTDVGIVFLYDPFVAAGAAVAFVGRNTVNCPTSWMAGSLDYDAFMKGGSWGNIHEFNHHYQKFGMVRTGSYPSEVTNNAINLVCYSLFTDISSSRTETGAPTYGEVGWNRHTVPSLALAQTLQSKAAGNTNSDLDTYANLLHSFGQDAFLQATKNGGGADGQDVWFRALCDATHYDMTYYFTDLLNQTVSAEVLETYAAKDYPMYVPVASVFQTGCSCLYDGKTYFSETVRPFAYTPNRQGVFEMDLGTRIVLPEGFTYEIKSVTQPEHGRVTRGENNVFTYTPEAGEKDSGKFYVTLGITKDDGAFAVEDVTLVFALTQSKPSNVLDRTVYTYSAENMYTSAKAAYEAGYAGYETNWEELNTNPTQNCNSDIWVPNPSSNAVMEIAGKVKIPSDGKYRFALRGRYNVALYLSLDGGETYSLAGEYAAPNRNASFHPELPETFSDYELEEGQWVYYKAVLIVQNDTYIGVGWGKFDGENVTINYLNGVNPSYEYRRYLTEARYPASYTYTYFAEAGEEQTLIESKYSPWVDGVAEGFYDIGVLFDEDDSNFIHSDRTRISEENPFEITVDLGKTVTANHMTVYGVSQSTYNTYQPKNYKLYVGASLEELTMLQEVTNAAVKNYNVDLTFDEAQFRYYKLVVTETYSRGGYIAIRKVDFSLRYESGRQVSPDEEEIALYGEWERTNEGFTFGHGYQCEKGEARFTFTGSRFAVLSRTAPACGSFEVYLDGELVAIADIDGSGETAVTYLSKPLEEGEHTVVLRAAMGTFNLDSIVLW